MSEPKRDNRNRRVKRKIVKIRFCEREEKVEEARGRESKEGPTCQRERKVDAPEEHEKSKREPYPLVIQYNQHSYRYVRDLTASFATNQRAKNILSLVKVILSRRDSIQKATIRKLIQ